MLRYLQGIVDRASSDAFDIVRCPNCGLAKTLPQPEDVGRYYQDYHGERHGFSVRYYVRRRMSFVREICGSGEGRALLDIGCGDGSQLIAAREDGWHVTGTEMHPDPPRRRGLHVATDISELPAEPTFDCITFWHSLEHLRDPLAALRLAAARLRENGALILAVPDNGGLQAKLFGKHWLHLDVPRHLYHFDRRSVEELLSAASMRPVRWWNQEFEYDLMGFVQSYLTWVMPTPNVFYDAITRKSNPAGAAEKLMNVAGGLLLSAVGTPIVWLTSAVNKGGTIVVAARPARTR